MVNSLKSLIYAYALMGMGPDIFGMNDKVRKILEPRDWDEFKCISEQKRKERLLNRGLSEWSDGNTTVLALNKKSAIKKFIKAYKLKQEIEDATRKEEDTSSGLPGRSGSSFTCNFGEKLYPDVYRK